LRAVSDLPVSELLGVKWLARLFAALPLIIGSTVLCGGLGAVGGMLRPTEYATGATLRVGLFFPKEEIERGVVAARRLEGAALRSDGDAKVSATVRSNRRYPRTGQLVDFTVRAKTASAATAALDAAVRDVEALHHQLQAFDAKISDEVASLSKSTATRLRRDVGTPIGIEAEGTAALALARHYETGMAVNKTRFSGPPTTVLSRREVAPRARRSMLFGLAGAIAGALLGLLIALGRDVFAMANVRPTTPLDRAVVFIADKGKLIGTAAVVCSVAGAAAGATVGTKHYARAVFRCARVAPNHTFQHISAVRLEAEAFLTKARAEICGEDCKLGFEMRPDRGVVHETAFTDMLHIETAAAEPKHALKALEVVGEHLTRSQQQAYVDGLEIWERRIDILRSDVDDLAAADPSSVDQAVLIDLIREMGSDGRNLNPARSWPPQVIVPPHIIATRGREWIGVGAIVGAPLGAFGALFLALLMAGWRARPTQ